MLQDPSNSKEQRLPQTLDLSPLNTKRLFPRITKHCEAFLHNCIVARQFPVGLGGLECDKPGGRLALLDSLVHEYPEAVIALTQFTFEGREQSSFTFVHNREIFDAIMHAVLSSGIVCATNFVDTVPSQMTLVEAVDALKRDPCRPGPSVCQITFDGPVTGAMIGRIMTNLAGSAPPTYSLEFGTRGLGQALLDRFGDWSRFTAHTQPGN